MFFLWCNKRAARGKTADAPSANVARMNLNVQLDAREARVFGVLIEKALTTPDQYPLSINAATNGANQKSNRDPVLSLSEDEVAAALHRLEGKYLARKVFPMNSRVEKFCHNGKDAFALGSTELAILAELLMRGPQTAGDLRGRVSRMAPIASIDELVRTLDPLIQRGFVQRLPPGPGSRAERYVQLLSPALHPLEPSVRAAPPPATAGAVPEPSTALHARVEALESEVQHLRQLLERLAERLAAPLE